MTHKTEAERLAWERQCYGMTEAEMRADLERAAKLVGWPMLAMSILSDAQEVIARMEGLSPGRVDASMNTARQYMNKAKWCIGAHLVDADLLARAMPFVEDAERDPALKRAPTLKLAGQIRDAIERLR